MTDNAVWWIETSGADGFRHDAVKHIPNRFWRTLTRKLRAVDSVRVARGEAPLYQIGETFGSYDLIASYVTPGQLDAQFNFNLYDTAKYVFLDPDADFAVLDAEMQKTLDVYGPDHVMGNLMDSHDKARFLAYADGDIARDAPDDKEIGWLTDIRVDDPASYRLAELYLAYLLTTPGVPTIYYGDEIGMTGANDPDNRRPMRWGDDVTPDEQALRERVSAPRPTPPRPVRPPPRRLPHAPRRGRRLGLRPRRGRRPHARRAEQGRRGRDRCAGPAHRAHALSRYRRALRHGRTRRRPSRHTHRARRRLPDRGPRRGGGINEGPAAHRVQPAPSSFGSARATVFRARRSPRARRYRRRRC